MYTLQKQMLMSPAYFLMQLALEERANLVYSRHADDFELLLGLRAPRKANNHKVQEVLIQVLY